MTVQAPGSGLHVFSVTMKETLNTGLLFLHIEYCNNISQCSMSIGLKKNLTLPWMLQIPCEISASVFFIQPLWWLRSNKNGCYFNETLHMACGSSCSFFHLVHLSHCWVYQRSSVLVNALCLLSSDVVAFEEREDSQIPWGKLSKMRQQTKGTQCFLCVQICPWSVVCMWILIYDSFILDTVCGSLWSWWCGANISPQRMLWSIPGYMEDSGCFCDLSSQVAFILLTEWSDSCLL